MPIFISLSAFLMSKSMPKVSIEDKMWCPLRVQYHENRLFNPIKVDCFAVQHTPIDTQPNNIQLYHIHLTLDSKCKISPNMNNYE